MMFCFKNHTLNICEHFIVIMQDGIGMWQISSINNVHVCSYCSRKTMTYNVYSWKRRCTENEYC